MQFTDSNYASTAIYDPSSTKVGLLYVMKLLVLCLSMIAYSPIILTMWPPKLPIFVTQWV